MAQVERASDPVEWLRDVIESSGDLPKMVAFGELVQRGLAEVSDIAELREAGLSFYEIEGQPFVWVEARAFVAACHVVAAVRDAAEAPARVH
ncbi:MAG: hypothetical protein U0900_02190 [Myxococcota bacterium]